MQGGVCAHNKKEKKISTMIIARAQDFYAQR